MTIVLLVLLYLTATNGFTRPPGRGRRDVLSTRMSLKTELDSQAQKETEMIRAQIEEMRQEAIERLQTLNKQVEGYRRARDVSVFEISGKVIADEKETTEDADAMSVAETLVQCGEGTRTHTKIKPKDVRSRLELLHGTTWKLAINIGREPGTWMPESWGKSGERLLLNLVVEFTDSQLFDREKFLNGMPGSKVLKVIDNKLSVGPSLTEGSKSLAVKDGGWRIAPAEGVAGTDLLRFYFEIEEVAQHKGCDVYCPKGRVYLTCGYFPMAQRCVSVKDAIRREQEALQQKYDRLTTFNTEDDALFSLVKIRRIKELFEIRIDAQKLNDRMHEARLREPERELLRLSPDDSVGLTREGGVCCKVIKSLAVEYHILGRFGVASVDKKDRHLESTRLRP